MNPGLCSKQPCVHKQSCSKTLKVFIELAVMQSGNLPFRRPRRYEMYNLATFDLRDSNTSRLASHCAFFAALNPSGASSSLPFDGRSSETALSDASSQLIPLLCLLLLLVLLLLLASFCASWDLLFDPARFSSVSALDNALKLAIVAKDLLPRGRCSSPSFHSSSSQRARTTCTAARHTFSNTHSSTPMCLLAALPSRTATNQDLTRTMSSGTHGSGGARPHKANDDRLRRVPSDIVYTSTGVVPTISATKSKT